MPLSGMSLRTGLGQTRLAFGWSAAKALYSQALAVEPEVLLMDEPTSVDPISTSKIEELALELKRNIL